MSERDMTSLALLPGLASPVKLFAASESSLCSECSGTLFIVELTPKKCISFARFAQNDQVTVI